MPGKICKEFNKYVSVIKKNHTGQAFPASVLQLESIVSVSGNSQRDCLHASIPWPSGFIRLLNDVVLNAAPAGPNWY